MTDNNGNNGNSGIIIAILAAGLVVAVLAVLYFSGAIGSYGKAAGASPQIAKQSSEKSPEKTGFTFKYEDGDGKKTELVTP